jgi:hypothetical protein
MNYQKVRGIAPSLRQTGIRTARRLSMMGFLCMFILTCFSFKAEASHYRYGNISYTWVSGRTVTFHISQSYRRTFYPGPPNVGSIVATETLNFGDGQSAPINLTITSVNTTEDWFYGEATITHTFVQAPTNAFTTFYSSSARLSTLINNLNLAYRSECRVVLNGPSSPASTMPPIVNVQTNQTAATFQIAAIDPNGTTLTYRFATAAEMGGGAQTQPAGMTVSNTGLVTFNTVGKAVNNLYNAAFVVTNSSGASTMVDVIVKIVQQSTPPTFDYTLTPPNSFVYNIQPGQNVTFQVKAKDIDAGNTVSLNAVGIPAGAVLTPTLPITGPGNPGVTTNFSWTPNISQLGTRIVNFIAQDNLGNQTTTSVTIITSLNPIFDVPPTLPSASFNCLETGTQFVTPIQAHAPDPLVTLRISAATTLPGVTYTPSVPTTFANTKSTTLNWTPTSAQWGVHTFNFTATDDLLHSTSHSYDLVVNTTPSFASTQADVTISVNEPFTYNVVANDPDVAFGDQLDIIAPGLPSWLTITQTGPTTATISGTPSAGDAGTYTIEVELEDVHHHCGPHVDQEFEIEVAPCTFVANVTPSVSGNQCPGTLVTLTANTADSYLWSTNETTQSITVVANGSSSYNVTSTSGFCTSTASVTVDGIDNQNPTITAPAPVSVPTDVNACAATNVALGNASGADNCGAVTITSDAPASFLIGNTTVTYTATDAAGNTATATQVVIVTDNQNPTVIAPAAVSVSADANACAATNVVLGNASGADNCGAVTITNDAPVSFAIGYTTVTYTATDAVGNTASATQVVTVTDNQNPTVIAPVAVSVSADANACAATNVTLGNASGADNCGAVTITNDAPVSFAIGYTTVTYTATDAAGNTATATQVVTVTDNQNPTVTAPAAVSVSADANACAATNVTLGNASGADNCGAVTITNDAPVSFSIGNTTVTYTATDAAGNTATATQVVTVTDNQNPTITAPAVVSVSADANACAATNVTLGNANAADNCGTVTITNNAPASYPVGNTTVTYTATDAAGNTATATQVVTVTDNQNPTITTPAAVTVNANAGQCAATNVTLGNANAADNCGAVTITNNAPASYPVGNTTVTYTATDAHGNTATATQVVTVVDNQNPMITAPANVTKSGWCTNVPAGSVNLGTPVTADNCGVATVVNNAPASYPVGQTTVTWTVTDIHGRTSTATQTVTVTNITLAATSSVNPMFPFPGQELQTIYLGYPASAQSVIIGATPSNGTAPYTYAWQRSGCNNTILAPLANTLANYSFAPTSGIICRADSDNVFKFVVTITDAHGCATTQQRNINVVDPYTGNKIKICHRPPGYPENTQLITVGAGAVPAHLDHGDNLGNCFNFNGKSVSEGEAEAEQEAMKTIAESLKFNVYPNPTTGTVIVELPKTGSVSVMITDVAGKVIVRQVISDNTQQQLQFNLSNEAKGMYFINVVNAGENYQSKLILQ